MATRPETAERIFFWSPHFARLYFLYAGRFFLVMGILGMVLYLVLLAILGIQHI
jgi:hypothetical protein